VNESEWLQESDPNALMTFLLWKGKISDRKRRLFSCACCRQVWPLLDHPCAREAVETAESYADGSATRADLRQARQAVRAARHHLRSNRGLAFAMYWAAEVAASENAFFTAPGEVARAAAPFPRWAPCVSPAVLSGLLRDLIGNPFPPPPAVRPSWLAWHGGAVERMARVIYEEARFADLPILADALEEAGCDSDPLLSHCRSGAAHARGCWALDLLLSRNG
jgi:hypothetical protein